MYRQDYQGDEQTNFNKFQKLLAVVEAKARADAALYQWTRYDTGGFYRQLPSIVSAMVIGLKTVLELSDQSHPKPLVQFYCAWYRMIFVEAGPLSMHDFARIDFEEPVDVTDVQVEFIDEQ